MIPSQVLAHLQEGSRALPAPPTIEGIFHAELMNVGAVTHEGHRVGVYTFKSHFSDVAKVPKGGEIWDVFHSTRSGEAIQDRGEVIRAWKIGVYTGWFRYAVEIRPLHLGFTAISAWNQAGDRLVACDPTDLQGRLLPYRWSTLSGIQGSISWNTL